MIRSANGEKLCHQERNIECRDWGDQKNSGRVRGKQSNPRTLSRRESVKEKGIGEADHARKF